LDRVDVVFVTVFRLAVVLAAATTIGIVLRLLSIE